ncbi:HepT-like ribonuclease domain-containing protein [Anaerosolibacter sp.]|uniref:HepT-like ribonuclease domain-containing protein n=1 Tax=Anaerosolibacter sp. TaxID=1872527 RepID=UPI0039F11CFE
MDTRDYQIINKLFQEIDVIEDLIEGFDLEKFIEDERTKRAVCMTLINIGELTKNITEDFKRANNSVPWRAIAGMRDITAHKYQTLKMGDVWITLVSDIPNVKIQLEDMLKNVKLKDGNV